VHLGSLGPGTGRRPPPVYHAPDHDPPDPDGPPDDGGLPPDDEFDPVQRSALRQPKRRAVFELVARTPGLNKNQVARRLGFPRTTTYHHIERLEAYDLLVLVDGAREYEVLCFHPEHEDLAEDDDTRLLYGQSPVRHVALYVIDDPGATTTDLVESMDNAPRTVQRHLSTLIEYGLVVRHRFEDGVEYHPSEVLEAWADEVGDRYRRPWTAED
jgi:DNA-binding transcriptional ArsR family regulator